MDRKIIACSSTDEGCDPAVVARSTDNGLSWSTVQNFNPYGGSDSGQDYDPSVMTDGDGNWTTVWYSSHDY